MGDNPERSSRSWSQACTSVPIANPKFVLAWFAIDAPVPPSAIEISVIPVIDPPVIEIAEESCVDTVPSPRFILASAAVEAPVPPSSIARSVIPIILPPTIEMSVESWVAILPRRKFALAPWALVEAVPPSSMGTTPLVISCLEIDK